MKGNTWNINVTVWVLGLRWFKMVDQQSIPLVENRKLIVDGTLFGLDIKFDPPL